MILVDIPTQITPEHLDHLLAEGWFRAGSLFARMDTLCLDHRLRGVRHVRMPLASHRPSKSQRRSLKKNSARFRTTIGPVHLDEHSQRLYAAMKNRFMGLQASSLQSIIHNNQQSHYDTLQVSVYDGQRLVAASFYDVGATSVYSMIGVWDPDYARHGLGIYTMIQEVRWAKSAGFLHYYPGYVVPGLARFDYKLSLGPMEYLAITGRWDPIESAPPRVPAAEAYLGRMADLERALTLAGVPFESRLYPAFILSLLRANFDIKPAHFMGLVAVRCWPDSDSPALVIEATPNSQDYRLSTVYSDPTIDLMDEFESIEQHIHRYEMDALAYSKELCVTPHAAQIAQAALRERPT